MYIFQTRMITFKKYLLKIIDCQPKIIERRTAYLQFSYLLTATAESGIKTDLAADANCLKIVKNG